ESHSVSASTRLLPEDEMQQLAKQPTVMTGTEVPPISLADLRARIGAPDATGVPLDVEQLSARIGAKTRGQAENSLNNSMNVEARQARVQGPLAESGISGPLVGRAIGRGGGQLKRALVTNEPLAATGADLNASLVRQTKAHNAN